MENEIMQLKETIKNNIIFIREHHGQTQKVFANNTGLSPTSIHNYEKGLSSPTVDALFRICRTFNVSLIEITQHSLKETLGHHQIVSSQADPLIRKSLDKYVNEYNVYFFKTAFENSDDVIYNGKMSIKKDRGEKPYKVTATFPNSDDGSKFYFEGSLNVIGRHTYISLNGKDHFEKCLLILHDPPSTSTATGGYIGGIGIVASVSQGRFRSPCAQKILISRKDLDIDFRKNSEESDAEKAKRWQKVCDLLKLGDKTGTLKSSVVSIEELEDHNIYIFLSEWEKKEREV